jgi:hypothetical protein
VQLHLVVYALRKTFDGDNRFSIRALCGIDTGNDGLAIHEDSARAAFRFFAADLCTGQAKSLTKKCGEGFT